MVHVRTIGSGLSFFACIVSAVGHCKSRQLTGSAVASALSDAPCRLTLAAMILEELLRKPRRLHAANFPRLLYEEVAHG